MPEITITISKDGSKVEADAQGFLNNTCSHEIEKLIGSLGETESIENKMEYYQKEEIHLKGRA